MTNVLVIHGSDGNPEENWFPWLKNELESKHKIQVNIPQFPVPTLNHGKHHYQDWFNKLKEFKDQINENTIFVTHSRGCIFILRALTDLGIKKVAAIYLVAPFIQYRWYESEQSIVDSFYAGPVDWAAVKSLTDTIEIFQSTDDEIPVEEGVGMAAMLDAHFEIIENAGHFNTRAGYTKFPLLFERISKILS